MENIAHFLSLILPHKILLYIFAGLCVGEIKEKLHFIFHTTVSVLYGKYSTMVGKYSMVGSPEISRI